MTKLTIYRSEHGSYNEALACGGLYTTSYDALVPEFISGDLSLYLSDIYDCIRAVIDASGRDDLICGSAIHGIFWTLEDLINYASAHGSLPEKNYPKEVTHLAELAHKGCGLIYELFEERYNDSIDKLVDALPQHVKTQVFKLAEKHGFVESQQRHAETMFDSNNDNDCSHGIDRDCCPAGCGDIDDLSAIDHDEESYIALKKLNDVDFLCSFVDVDDEYVNAIYITNAKLAAHKYGDYIKFMTRAHFMDTNIDPIIQVKSALKKITHRIITNRENRDKDIQML